MKGCFAWMISICLILREPFDGVFFHLMLALRNWILPSMPNTRFVYMSL